MNKGFTLIELLAVIVILAIIALIATPIVLSIINDSKQSATIRSAEFYANAVQNKIMQENMKQGGTLNPEECIIGSDGNVTCDGTFLEIEVNGEKPTSGSIKFDKGKVTDVSISFGDKTVTMNSKGEFVMEDSDTSSEKPSSWSYLGSFDIDLTYDGEYSVYYSYNTQTTKDGILISVDGEACSYVDYLYDLNSRTLEYISTGTTDSGYSFSVSYIEPYYIISAPCDGSNIKYTKTITDSSTYEELMLAEGVYGEYLNGPSSIKGTDGNIYYYDKANDAWSLTEATSVCNYNQLNNYYFNSSDKAYSNSCDGSWTPIGKITYNDEELANYGISGDKFIGYKSDSNEGEGYVYSLQYTVFTSDSLYVSPFEYND